MALNLGYNKNTNCIKFLTIDPQISIDFYFSKKDLGLVSLPDFVYDFSSKMFLVLHSVNGPYFTV